MTSTAQPLPSTPIEPRMRELMGGVAILRLLVILWAVVVVTVDARSEVLTRPAPAVGLLAVVTAWSALGALGTVYRPSTMTSGPVLVADVALAAAVAAADWYVYAGGHPQSFGSAWPATSVMLVAVIAGWRWGLGAGVMVATASILAAGVAERIGGRGLALTGNLVLLATTGAVGGWVSARLMAAEFEVAAARERERFARTLHDGVLQTLAVIQRRSTDRDLIEMARDQEAELRAFIGSGPRKRGDLVSELRALAARAERIHRIPVEVVVVEVADLSPSSTEALVGAAQEAVSNAARHGSPTQVTICVDRANDGGGIHLTVIDDGCGFDQAETAEGTGIGRSIRGRMSEVGGRAEVRSVPGRGTEVALWMP